MNNFQTNKNNRFKFNILLFSLLIILVVSVYFDYYKGIATVYSHLFYVIIVMMGLWFQRYTVHMAVFLGVFHIILHYISEGVFLAAPFLRGIILIFVAIILSALRNDISDSHEVLDKIVKRVGDGIIAVDLNKKVTTLNKSAEEITGWRSEESKGMDIHDIYRLSQENEEYSIVNPFDEVIEMDSVYESAGQAIIMAKDGKKIHTEYSASPIKDINGKISGGILIFRDTTEKEERNKQIEYLRFRDLLTGLYNKKYFEGELINLDSERFYPLSIIMADLNSLKSTNDAFGNHVGDELIKKSAEVINKCCRKSDVIARWCGGQFAILFPNTNEEAVEEVASRINEAIGKIDTDKGFLSISMGWDTKKFKEEDITITLKNAEDSMYKRKLNDKLSFRGKSINTIMEILFEKSESEREHSSMVSIYAAKLAKAMGLSSKEVDAVAMLGRVHDIGKIFTESNILNKNEKLTEDEWNEIKRHPEIGYRIFNIYSDMSDMAINILAHHERWDGSGYPKGLVAEEIPKVARIISIAEAYDDMISERPYKEPLEKEQAIEEILACAGSQFDPEIAKIFVEEVLKEDTYI